MSKYAAKIGKVGKNALISVQSDMRKNRIDSMISKDNLTKKEERLVGAKSILGNTSSTGGKLGKFGFKNQRIGTQLGSFNTTNTPTNINEALNMNSSLSVKSFITDSQSKTGVLSQKDVSMGVDNFMSSLRDAAGVKDINVNKQGNKISNIDVFADYRKTELSFNPRNLSFTTQGWQLDIPDDFKKVSDTKFVAPETEFKDYMSYKKKDSGSTNKNYDYSTYNPVEIILQDGGNKIKEILKRDTYQKTYNYEQEADGARNYSRDYDIFISEKQDFYDTGLLKSINKWNDYTPYEYEKEIDRSKGTDVDRERTNAIFKSNEQLFTDKGFKASDKSWADYGSKYDKQRSQTGSKMKAENAIYLQSQTDYDDYGQKLREQQYDDYLTKKEKSYGYETSTKEERDAYLKYDTYFTDGKKVAQVKYDDFLTDYNVDSKNSYVGENDEGIMQQLASQSYYKYNPEKLDKYSNVQKVKGQEEEFAYKIGIDRITYYDPLTGNEIRREEFN